MFTKVKHKRAWFAQKFALLFLVATLVFVPFISAGHQIELIAAHDAVESTQAALSELSVLPDASTASTENTICGFTISCHAPAIFETIAVTPFGPLMPGVIQPEPGTAMVGLSFGPATPPPLT